MQNDLWTDCGNFYFLPERPQVRARPVDPCLLHGVGGCWRVGQGVAGCCRVLLQGVAGCCRVLQGAYKERFKERSRAAWRGCSDLVICIHIHLVKCIDTGLFSNVYTLFVMWIQSGWIKCLGLAFPEQSLTCSLASSQKSLFWDVSCLISHLSSLISHVSCLMSHVSCLMSHVSCLMSHVSCLMSHVPCLMSLLSCSQLNLTDQTLIFENVY